MGDLRRLKISGLEVTVIDSPSYMSVHMQASSSIVTNQLTK